MFSQRVKVISKEIKDIKVLITSKRKTFKL